MEPFIQPGYQTFTKGSVVFGGVNQLPTQDNANLFWDNTNKYLGIGTSIPQFPLDVRGTIAIQKTNTGGTFGDFYLATTNGDATIRIQSGGSNQGFIRYNNSGQYMSLSNGLYTNDQFVILTGGNVGINTITPQQKLDITDGNLRFSFVTKPTALTAALAGAGAGNLTNGVYSYEVTFITSLGSTEAGTASSTVTVTDATTNGQIALTAIPVSSDANVTSRKIYRTIAGGSTYKLLTTISDNTTTTFTDNVADASLGATAPVINTTSGKIYVNGTIMMTFDSATGNIGMPGATAPNAATGINYAQNFNIDQAAALSINATHQTATAGQVSGYTITTTASNSTGTMNAVQGCFSQVAYIGAQSLQANVAVTNMYGTFSRTGIGGTSPTGTVTNAFAFHIDPVANQAGGTPAVTFTNAYGVYIRDQGLSNNGTTFTISNTAGILIRAQSANSVNHTDLVVGQSTIPAGSNGLYVASIQGIKVSPAARTSGSNSLINVVAPADTGLTIAEVNDVSFNLSASRQFTTGGGTIANQRSIYIQSPTYTANTNAVTLTSSSTVYISGAPAAGSNVTITSAYALRINAGNVYMGGLISTYNAVATTGWGVPAIYASTRATGQTAANTSVSTYTVGAADGSFEVSANVNITTSSAENFTVTCTYTDETNTSRVATLNFSLLAGTIGTAVNFANGAVPYEGIPVHIRCKASTAITIKTTGTFTGATYNVEGIIKQMA